MSIIHGINYFMNSKKDVLDRINTAMDKYSAKQAKKYAPKKKKARSKKPELLVESAIKKWAENNHIEIFKTDSAATYNHEAGRYLRDSALHVGHSDFSGSDRNGYAIFIEAKAKDRRNNVSLHQFKFLTSKIDKNCFAVVVDCERKLDFFYKTWLELKLQSKHKKAQEFLRSCLPKSKKVRERLVDEQADPF